MFLLSPPPQRITFSNGEQIAMPVALIDGLFFLTESRNIIDIVGNDDDAAALALAAGNWPLKRREQGVEFTLKSIRDQLVEATILDGKMYVNTIPFSIPFLDENGEVVVFPRGLTLAGTYELPPFAGKVNYICDEARFTQARGLGRDDVVCPDWRLHSETAALRDRQDLPRLTRRLLTHRPSEVQQWY